MSWWVYLQDTAAPQTCDYGTTLEDWTPKYSYDTEPCSEPCYPNVAVERHAEGGTYTMGGISEAEVNVTYNYSKHFHEAIDGGLRRLHGMQARQAEPILEHAVDMLGTERDSNYWKATPGNAGHALSILLGWARQHPDAVFVVS